VVLDEVVPQALCGTTFLCSLETNACHYERVVKKTVARKITKARAMGMLETSSFLMVAFPFMGLKLLSDATGEIDEHVLAQEFFIMGLGRTTDATNAGVLV